MPTILLIVDDEPETIVDVARNASDEILRLVNAEIPPDQSVVDRLKEITRHAVKLAKAYKAIEAEARAEHVRSATREEDASVSQGCAAEVDPNTN